VTVVCRNTFDTRELLVENLAEAVVEKLRAAIANSGRASLAVSGGNTPKALFKALSHCDVSWQNVDIYLVDERDVPPSDDRSNEKLVRQTLLINKAKSAEFFPLNSETVATGTWPDRFDVALLGLGTDGHTASWFPGGNNLVKATAKDCDAKVMTMLAPGIPENRFTFTLPVICNSTYLALHIEGQEKLDTLNVAEQSGSAGDMPIRHLIRSNEAELNVYWAA